MTLITCETILTAFKVSGIEPKCACYLTVNSNCGCAITALYLAKGGKLGLIPRHDTGRFLHDAIVRLYGDVVTMDIINGFDGFECKHGSTQREEAAKAGRILFGSKSPDTRV